MSVMNFLRCNKCYEPLKASNPPFSLTQCGHLFCSKCINNDNQCYECKATGVESLPLTHPLPDRVASLFVPASELLEQFVFTYKFQHAEMMITMRRFEEIEKKYNGMKMAYWKLRKHTEELTKAYKNLQQNQLQFHANRNNTPGQQNQGFVNIPRSYFAANSQQNNSQRNNNNRPSHMVRVQPTNIRSGIRFNVSSSDTHEAYQTDDSMSSVPTNRTRNNIETPPITPDVGIFRIPNVRNVPRSTGTSSGTSRNSTINTPVICNKMF